MQNKKIDARNFVTLAKNYGSVYKRLDLIGLIFSILFIWPTTVFFVICEIWLFVRMFFNSIWKPTDDFLDKITTDNIAYRVVVLVIVSPLILWKLLFDGIFLLVQFIFGFFYDVFNKIWTLGMSETYFLDL
jgi:hypothetical protein